MTVDRKNKVHFLKNVTAPLSPFHIEADKTAGGISMMISGVTGVNEFSENNVLLRLRGMNLKIMGSSLCLTVYENKTVEIVGNIEITEYCYDKTR